MKWDEAFKAILRGARVRRALWMRGLYIRKWCNQILLPDGPIWAPTSMIDDMQATDWEIYGCRTYKIRVGDEVYRLDAETKEEAVIKSMNRKGWICTGSEGISFAVGIVDGEKHIEWSHGYVVWTPVKAAAPDPRVVWLVAKAELSNDKEDEG